MPSDMGVNGDTGNGTRDSLEFVDELEELEDKETIIGAGLSCPT
jgi:hypothetical protein